MPYSVDELTGRVQRADRRERAPRVLHPSDRVLRLRRARRRRARQPGRDRDHELAVGAVSRRGGAQQTASAPRSRPGSASSPNIVPHVSKATGVYVNSMLAVTEANNAGYDEAILLTPEGTVADGSGREHLHRARRRHLHARLSTGILPGITRDTVTQIAAGPRLHRRREVADPLRSLPRGRGVHVRHGRRGDAAALGRRPRDRCRAGDACRSSRRTSTPCAVRASGGRSGSTTCRSSPAA